MGAQHIYQALPARSFKAVSAPVQIPGLPAVCRDPSKETPEDGERTIGGIECDR